MRVDQLNIGPDLVCEVWIKFGIQYFRPFHRRGITPSAWGGIITALASAVRQLPARPVETSPAICGLLRFAAIGLMIPVAYVRHPPPDSKIRNAACARCFSARRSTIFYSIPPVTESVTVKLFF